MDWKEKLEEAWKNRDGFMIFSTADASGMPNSVYVLGVKLLSDGRFGVIDNYFNKTRENIMKGSRGSLLFIAKPRTSYQVKGSIEYVTSGALFEELKAEIPEKYPRVGAALLTVDEFYSGAERLN
ncbi:MAG TPA: pyridoxamine 5'-phosphate oxidase family protein [Elusimicrobiales bacterium]|nr:pyridoxamine 5'-phosphate oxidase family protein [Elusimicrobiales bacterium]